MTLAVRPLRLSLGAAWVTCLNAVVAGERNPYWAAAVPQPFPSASAEVTAMPEPGPVSGSLAGGACSGGLVPEDGGWVVRVGGDELACFVCDWPLFEAVESPE